MAKIVKMLVTAILVLMVVGLVMYGMKVTGGLLNMAADWNPPNHAFFWMISFFHVLWACCTATVAVHIWRGRFVPSR